MGKYSQATIEIVDAGHDLAVLRLGGPPEVIGKEAQTGLDMAGSDPAVGEKICFL